MRASAFSWVDQSLEKFSRPLQRQKPFGCCPLDVVFEVNHSVDHYSPVFTSRLAVNYYYNILVRIYLMALTSTLIIVTFPLLLIRTTCVLCFPNNNMKFCNQLIWFHLRES